MVARYLPLTHRAKTVKPNGLEKNKGNIDHSASVTAMSIVIEFCASALDYAYTHSGDSPATVYGVPGTFSLT